MHAHHVLHCTVRDPATNSGALLQVASGTATAVLHVTAAAAGTIVQYCTATHPATSVLLRTTTSDVRIEVRTAPLCSWQYRRRRRPGKLLLLLTVLWVVLLHQLLVLLLLGVLRIVLWIALLLPLRAEP